MFEKKFGDHFQKWYIKAIAKLECPYCNEKLKRKQNTWDAKYYYKCVKCQITIGEEWIPFYIRKSQEID